jgi:hypothetical protein
LIYSWERERVFWTCLVETSIFDAHSKLPTGLWDDKRVGQPPWVMDLLNEASIKQLFVLFTDEVLPLNELFLGLLLDLSAIGLDIQIVLNHLPYDPGHL